VPTCKKERNPAVFRPFAAAAASVTASMLLLTPRAEAVRAYYAELEPGYAMLSADASLLHGGSLGGRFYVAARELLVVGGAARYTAAGGAGTAHLATVAASAMFRLDVLQWVPFFSVDAGYQARSLPGEEGVGHGLEFAFGLGADYLVSRDFAIGAALRYHVTATATSRLPAMLSVGMRIIFH